MLAHSASMRSAGSGGPSIPGIASCRIDGIAGMQFDTPRPASREEADVRVVVVAGA